MREWFGNLLNASSGFMPHGHCYLWIPAVLWLHVVSDILIGAAYIGIAAVLWVLVRRIRLPFSPVFVAFGLFIGLCGLTHFMDVWTVWNPDYVLEGLVKAATAVASVVTAVGLLFVKPQVEEVVHAARLSEERRTRLESAHAELEMLYAKVKELDELKSQFFANVSHELRTPLALIVGPTEQLLAEEGLRGEQRRRLEYIRDNGRTLLNRVNDLLDLSKLDAGKMAPHYVQFDVVPWFRRLASHFSGPAEQRGIAYEVRTPATLVAQTDPAKLERMLVNLLSNAFKFTPQGGRMSAELSLQHDQVAMTVRDSGPGIKPEDRAIVFERFRQVDGAATRSFGGTGLGLAIVKELVELLHGKVWVDDAPEGGAQLRVQVPTTAPEGSSVAIQAPGTSHVAETAVHELVSRPVGESPRVLGTGMAEGTVLVVEDNAEMREFIAGVLATDVEVVTASHGADGLAMAESLKPDVIVSDMMMPGMSGEQLVTELRGRANVAATPVLLLTARADDDSRVRLLERGAQDYLTKPFLPAELRARVRNLAVGKRTADILRAEAASLSTDLEALAKEVAAKSSHLRTALDAAEFALAQAERASQAKSYFLGLLSHEFRTPLSTIYMNLQMLAADRSAELPAPLRVKIDRLTRASRQLATLIDGLLEYTRLDSGRVEARAEPIDVGALCDETVAEWRLHLTSDRVQIGVESTTGPAILSDPRLLKVAVSNLLGNAVKFTTQGRITLTSIVKTDECVIEVRDTGIGIAKEDLERVFLPFEQIEPLERKTIPGAGLGLTMVRQIARAMGGRVEVNSEAGVGSTFRLVLPSGVAASAA